MRIFVLILVSLCYSVLATGQSSRPFLTDLTKNNADKYHPGLRAYASGNYERAYELLQTAAPDEVPRRDALLANALVYQRNRALLLKMLRTQPELVPDFHQFYVQQPTPEIRLGEPEVSAALTQNRFRAVLNGKDTVTILLDTGGSGAGINAKWVETYELPTDTTLRSRGVLPAFNVAFFKHPTVIPRIDIGALTLRHIPATYSVADPTSTGTYTGPEFDIILGLDVFIGYLDEVVFDWENKMIRFRETATAEAEQPFIFYNSKPFTAYRIDDEAYTTILDTGSRNDILDKEIYLKKYTKKEKKTYGEYTYYEYTVDLLSDGTDSLQLKIGDYTDDLHLVIGDEPVGLLLGNNHQRLVLNIKDNRFLLK